MRARVPSTAVVQHQYVSSYHNLEVAIRNGWRIYSLYMTRAGFECDLYKVVEVAS